MTRAQRGGFTLIELMTVLAIISVTSVVAALALGTAFAPTADIADFEKRALEARRRAIETGVPVWLPADSASPDSEISFMPDGRAIGVDVDPLIGSWVSR